MNTEIVWCDHCHQEFSAELTHAATILDCPHCDEQSLTVWCESCDTYATIARTRADQPEWICPICKASRVLPEAVVQIEPIGRVEAIYQQPIQILDNSSSVPNNARWRIWQYFIVTLLALTSFYILGRIKVFLEPPPPPIIAIPTQEPTIAIFISEPEGLPTLSYPVPENRVYPLPTLESYPVVVTVAPYPVVTLESYPVTTIEAYPPN